MRLRRGRLDVDCSTRCLEEARWLLSGCRNPARDIRAPNHLVELVHEYHAGGMIVFGTREPRPEGLSQCAWAAAQRSLLRLVDLGGAVGLNAD